MNWIEITSIDCFDNSRTFCRRRHWTKLGADAIAYLRLSLIQNPTWILPWQFIYQSTGRSLWPSIAVYPWYFKAREYVFLWCWWLSRIDDIHSRPQSRHLSFLRTYLLCRLPLTTAALRHNKVGIFPWMRRKKVLPMVQGRIKHTVFWVTVGERPKVMQDALIKIAGSRWKNVFYWCLWKDLTVCWILKLELLLTTLDIQILFGAIFFHRSCTFSWSRLLHFSFKCLWRIYSIYV